MGRRPLRNSMIFETAYAKINLALHVRRRRADGYHDLESLFAFACDGDELSAELSDRITLQIDGRFGEGLSAGDDNLVMRAAHSMRTEFGVKQGAALSLDKKLPIASGIGGGSADAAATLRLLARLWGIDPHHPTLLEIARSLGADVPACLNSVTVWGEGRGDELCDIEIEEITGTSLLLINPLIPLATGPVFAGWDQIDRGLLVPQQYASARNDLTASATAIVPQISKILATLAVQPGIVLARMSGSGATCFGMFESRDTRDAAAVQFRDIWCLATRLR